MLGAISGDVIGSIYEKNNIKTKNFQLFNSKDRFTDDTVMTCAVALACIDYVNDKNKENFRKNLIKYMQSLGRKYINAGYGRTFIMWILTNNPKPYNSWGNGSAMRVSPIAYVSNDLKEAEELAKISASVSHNHPSGIAGAKAIASAIWLLNNGSSKEQVKKYISDKYYDLNFSIDEIRKSYEFDVSCNGSVPQAINCFLESNNFEDCIRNAISIGGDSDTIAAISGSLAESYYGVPKDIIMETFKYLDNDLLKIVDKFYNEVLNKDLVNNGIRRNKI